MKIILTLLISFTMSTALAKRDPASWVMSDRYEKKRGTEINHSVIQFQKGSSSVTYKPENPPYGLISNERVLLEGSEYFLTGWAKGASTVLFRVFLPEKSGNIPVCEITSFAESSSLKLGPKKSLQIQAIELESEDDFKWVDCKLD